MLVAQTGDVGLFKVRFDGKLAVRGELRLLRLRLRNDIGQRRHAREGFADAAGQIGAQVFLPSIRQRLGGLLVRGVGFLARRGPGIVRGLGGLHEAVSLHKVGLTLLERNLLLVETGELLLDEFEVVVELLE